MSLKDRLSGLVRSDSPDSQREMDILTGSQSENPPEPNEDLIELSEEEIAWRLTEMTHQERKDILEDESFILHHWKPTRKVIDENEELRKKYGQDGRQRGPIEGVKVCLNHEALLEEDPYKPKQQETVGHTHNVKKKRKVDASIEIDTGNVPGMPSGKGSVTGGPGKDNTRQASAKQTEITGSQTMTICMADPHDCPTSLKAFYQAADNMYKIVQDKYRSGIGPSTKRKRTSENFANAQATSSTERSRSTGPDTSDPQQTTSGSNTTETDRTTATDSTQSSDTAAQSNTNTEQGSNPKNQSDDSTATTDDADTTQTDLTGWEHQSPPTENNDTEEKETEQWEHGKQNTDNANSSDDKDNASDFDKRY